jgi:hypothetical protein
MSLRRARKNFRKEIHRTVSAGEGDSKSLMELADAFFGTNQVGYHEVIKSFCQAEVNNATSQLRNEGLIESVGRQWKPVDRLASEDIDLIQVRRQKRVRGELKAGMRMAHERGDIKLATVFGAAASALSLSEQEPAESVERQVEVEQFA